MPHLCILETLLFLVYINDGFNTKNITEYITYTDDKSIFLTGANANVMIVCANSVLGLLSKWINCNHLVINR